MTRSRPAVMIQNPCLRPGQITLRRAPLAAAIAAILAGGHGSRAADVAGDTGSLEEITVTAQKRTENLQDVPISMAVLDNTALEQRGIVDLDDVVKNSPDIAYVRGQGQGGNGQPGSSHIYIRGVVSGGDGNHSGSQPSVGVYLDEEPVTTIDGTVDVHLYDIQRIEVLEGPQGTLYGASSEAGTVRIITNKPDPSKFATGYDVDVNRVDHGGTGYEAEGFANIPLSPIAAIRLVGWDEKDAGFIDNVAGTDTNACIQNGVRTFPTWSGNPAGTWYSAAVPSQANVAPCPPVGKIGAGAISNAAYVQNNYNTVETRGGRAALKLDLGDDWYVLPTVMGQSLDTNGFFGYDPAVGDLDVVHFGPENSQDSFVQTALTINGKFSDFEVQYAGAYMKRTTHTIADYSDYSEFYDRTYGSGAFWTNSTGLLPNGTPNGTPIMPQELVVTKGYFEKWSHEVRLSTPKNLPVRATIGAFIQRQQHDIWEQYTMPGYGFTNPYGGESLGPNPNGLGSYLTIPGLENTIWLTDEQRVDRDKAVFFDGSWDLTQSWQLNGGLRYFEYDNSLEGFYGYSANYDAVLGITTGAANCFAPATTPYAPCTDLKKEVSDSGTVPRVNLTYKFSPERLLYATYSKGFRPGGVNRTAEAGIGPYAPDFLTNYEIGWKTSWFNHHVRWNGALFWEDWKNFQFSFLGPSSLTIIENGGNARIKGIENEIEWQVSRGLNLSTSFTFLDPRLTTSYCAAAGVTYCPDLVTSYGYGPNLIGPQAPAGTNLPVSPKFKGNVVARYVFSEVDGWEPFGQLSFMYQTQTAPLLLTYQVESVGMQPAYGLADLTLGMHDATTQVRFVVENLADRRAELTRFTQTTQQSDNQAYIIPAQPRTFFLKFGQKF